MKIIGHYYVAKDNNFDKYDDKIQWEVTSLPEWTKFLVNLKTMPKDEEKNNPMGLKQPEVIHFNVSNSDKKSGHDIFISKAGIQQFSRMPLDRYFASSLEFKEFLDTELSMNPGYDTTSGEVDINTPGIVVIYRGSQQLKNPYWIIPITDKKVIERYKTYIKSLKPGAVYESSSTSQTGYSVDETPFESEGTYILYLNYPDSTQQFMVVGIDGQVRGTNIQQKYYYFKDAMGYFSMFKRQAEDNLHATQITEEAPEEKRRREALKGNLF